MIFTGTYIWWKNLIDRFFAVILLLVLLPFLLLIALLIRLDSSGSPIFCQERVGQNGRRFMLYKFRSMYQNHDDSKYISYMKKYVQENLATVFDENGKDIYEFIHDPRITRLGALLRRSNLDELPQLVNVLKGEMSFIGPRPDIPLAVNYYKKHHYERFRAKPGITGLWQVLPNRRLISFDEVVQTDLEYIRRQSLTLDIKILWQTMLDMVSLSSRNRQKMNEFKIANGMKV